MLLLVAISMILASPPIQETAPKAPGTRFGRSVLALDDLDGDGVREIAVGAPATWDRRGAVLVLSGKTQDVLTTWQGPDDRTTFGHTLRSIQDVNEDGVADVLVGFEFWARTELRSGKDGQLVHAIDRGWEEVIPFGDFDGDGAGDLLLTTTPYWEVRSGRTNQLLNGRSLSPFPGRFDPIGDVDGDGLVDGIYFGKSVVPMLSARVKGENLGLTKLFAMRNRPTVQAYWPQVFGDGNLPAGGGKSMWRAAPAGDLDGDGHNDFLMALTHKKSSALIGLSFHSRSGTLTRVEGLPSYFGDEPTMGYATLGGVDLDDDGCDDVVFGNTLSPFGVQVVAVPGAVKEPARAKEWPTFEGALWHSEWEDDGPATGVSIAAFDDIDGDGTRDVLVGGSDWFWQGTVARNGTLRLLSGRTGTRIWMLTEDRYEELGLPIKGPK